MKTLLFPAESCSLSPVLGGEGWGEGPFGSIAADQFSIFNFQFSIFNASCDEELSAENCKANIANWSVLRQGSPPDSRPLTLTLSPEYRGEGTGSCRASGFTLIEMLVVLALAAILSTIVTVSMIGPFRAARAEDVIGTIANYDRSTREYSRRFGRPGRIVFDLGRGTITRAAAETDAESRDKVGGTLHMPWGFHLGRLVTAAGAATSGVLSIDCSPDGQTPSYAIGVTDAKGEQYWMVTAGLTGKTLKARDEQEVQDIFRAINSDPARSTSGDDAH